MLFAFITGQTEIKLWYDKGWGKLVWMMFSYQINWHTAFRIIFLLGSRTSLWANSCYLLWTAVAACAAFPFQSFSAMRSWSLRPENEKSHENENYRSTPMSIWKQAVPDLSGKQGFDCIKPVMELPLILTRNEVGSVPCRNTEINQNNSLLFIVLKWQT